MVPKILIIQERLNDSDAFTGYKATSDFLGYKNQVCHDAHTLLKIKKAFDPNIIFWIYPRSDDIADVLRKYRQDNNKLKAIWMDDHYGHIVGDPSRYYDHLFVPMMIRIDQFQKIVTEWFLDSSEYDPNNQVKQHFLHQLSDNALRQVVAEQMWPNEKSYMERLMERNDQGDLNEDDRTTLENLIQRREQLMQRKAEAASILLDRGYSGSVEELIAESKRLD